MALGHGLEHFGVGLPAGTVRQLESTLIRVPGAGLCGVSVEMLSKSEGMVSHPLRILHPWLPPTRSLVQTGASEPK